TKILNTTEQIADLVFFDVRYDSDALCAHYSVALQGVEDVQLMESSSRVIASRKFLSGLNKCVEKDLLSIPWEDQSIAGRKRAKDWKLTKEKGERLFKAEQGGSYEIFNQRPIPDEIIAYCVGAVQCLPGLRKQLC
ncbi:hypothetical protein K458DRAFT_449901, partial [Lentithecium fluviatile CBS 122367]